MEDGGASCRPPWEEESGGAWPVCGEVGKVCGPWPGRGVAVTAERLPHPSFLTRPSPRGSGTQLSRESISVTTPLRG